MMINKLIIKKDACLYFELTIKETFYYFGKLYKLDDKEIKRRAEFLVDLLDLPTTDRLACYLRFLMVLLNIMLTL